MTTRALGPVDAPGPACVSGTGTGTGTGSGSGSGELGMCERARHIGAISIPARHELAPESRARSQITSSTSRGVGSVAHGRGGADR